jgi:hypothetical protein
MSRALPLLALIPLSAPGCIIYEEHYHGGKCQIDCTPADPGETPSTGTGPRIDDATTLTVDQGYPGQQLLTKMISTGPDAVDLSTFSSISFERDVDVGDTIVDPNDVILLLDIAAEAEPGDVTIRFTTSPGR